jgi:hypothetical protein
MSGPVAFSPHRIERSTIMTASSLPSAPGGPNRRAFLGRCAGCALAAGCVSAASIGSVRAQAPAPGPAPGARKPRIKLVFSHVPAGTPTWPYSTYDYETRKAALTSKLVAACPEIEFDVVTIHNGAAAKALAEQSKDVDGALVYMIGIWTGAGAAMAATGKPTLFVDDLYGGSGEFLTAFAAARRAGQNVAGVSSTSFDDVVAAARCLNDVADPAAAASFGARCMKVARSRYAKPGDVALAPGDEPPAVDVKAAVARLREATMLVVGGAMHNDADPITRALGTRLVPIDFATLDSYYKVADADAAKAFAAKWTKNAAKVVEPSSEEIDMSARMAVGMKALMAEHKADAIAINCLGGFYGKHMTAYPCIGFCQLNDDGQVGACEADTRSAITMLAMSYLTGRPGYISDPVIDTSKNQIIYAHCVAPTKVYGPGGPSNAYELRSHSEDRHGVSIRSLPPVGRMTTTLEIDAARKQVLVHQAKAVANIDEDKACRTKIAAEVKGDMAKLLASWDQWGWHRVTVYGDLIEPVAALADAIGFEMVRES